jgi:hypothetical protein
MTGWSRWNRRCDDLRRRAQLLVDENRDDSEAVAELSSVTGRHLADARAAALWFSESDWNRESRRADRAHRLLTAVANKSPVTAASPDDLRRFDRVDALLALPGSQAYELLVNLEPRLAAVALQAESGDLGSRLEPPDFRQARERRERDLVMQQAKAYEKSVSRLARALDPLVGPSAESADELVRTHAAGDVADNHVDSLRPSGDRP